MRFLLWFVDHSQSFSRSSRTIEERLSQGFRVAQRQIALREREFDAVFVKRIPDAQHDLAAHVRGAICWISDPEAQFEVNSAVAKFLQQAGRLGNFETPGGRTRSLDREAHREGHIGTV